MANKYLNFDGLSHLIDKLKASIAKKVDKEEGKKLSSNDYTDTEKTKLAGIEDGAEVNIQSDWNQNDETADDYVKNRTHWVETTVCTLADNVSLEGFSDWGDYWGTESTLPFEIQLDTIYTVVWDGVEYVCPSFTDSWGYISFGNDAITGGSDTGEPFHAMLYEGETWIYTFDTGDTHTISITCNVTEYHKIDCKYLPQSDWNENDQSKGTYISNRTHWTDDTEYLLPEEDVSGFKSDTYTVGDRTVTAYRKSFESDTIQPVPLGKTITVVWDGVSYDTITFDTKMTDATNENYTFCCGNGSIAGSNDVKAGYPIVDTGEPFFISGLIWNGGGALGLYSTDNASNHKISIYMAETHPLDEKYIPSTIARTSDVETALAEKGAGDMLKSVYDTDGDGIVDNAEKLGGQLPSYYAAASAIPTKTSQLTNDSGFKTTDTTYSQATSSALGLVKIGYSENGKNYPVELNTSGQMFVNVPWTDNNTVYTHPTYTAKSSGLYKVTVDGTGHVSGTAAVTKSDITALGIPAQDTTYTLSSFGVNATSTELNYVSGATSNIQT